MRADNRIAKIERVPMRDRDLGSSRRGDAPARHQRKTERVTKTTGVSGNRSGAFDALLRRHVCHSGSENRASVIDVGKSIAEIAI